jgi:D-serine deaminase-like pyridoxal phosphate-dependent protein
MPMHFSDLQTPALTIDLNVLESNLAQMAAFCLEHKLGLRPHTKTHKTLEIARMQLAHGAVGLTVAKVGEAEVMSGAAPDEILVAFPILGAESLRRLAALAHARRILVSLDSTAAAHRLSAAATAQGVTFGVLVEFDAGLGRCGLPPGRDCVALAAEVRKLPGLSFRGVLTYPGNIGGTEAQRREQARGVARAVRQTLEAFEAERIPVEIVSGGSTPSAFMSEEIPGLTEIRPGTYVYNDLNTYVQGACRLEDCAARVVATIVSTAVPGRAIIDAGSKTLSSDLLRQGPQAGYGLLAEAPDARLFKLNEEHGYVDITQSSHHFEVGETVTVIPNHVCTCVNMHDEVFLLRDRDVVGTWQVAARGKIR